MRPSDLVVRFVRGIGRAAEAEYYLSLFQSERRESFATIAVDEGALAEAGGALAVDLDFLARLDLSPVLVFSGPGQARALLDYFDEGDVDAAIVDPGGAAAVARAGGIPLVALSGASLEELVAQLRARKVVFLGLRPGLERVGGEIPSLVDVGSEYEELSAPGALSAEQRELLTRARHMIDAADYRLTVSVTTPLDLLRELFTVRGAGTLIRRGASIRRAGGWAELDHARMTTLIESAFSRPPLPGLFGRPTLGIYVADDYRGAAVVEPSPLGPYLSKFAVDVRARGEGVGRDLWRALGADCRTLFWRSRPDNPIASWYVAHCDGMMRAGSWQVFWRGLAPEEVPRAIDYAASLPADFGESGKGG